LLTSLVKNIDPSAIELASDFLTSRISLQTIKSEALDVVGRLLKNASVSTVGDVYEAILGDLSAAGNYGEFYTPRLLTRTLATVATMQRPDEVVDPACGTGGFLLSALSTGLVGAVVGVEKKPLPFSLCVANLALHEAAVPCSVVLGNGIEFLASREASIDAIVTNPPFGASEDEKVRRIFGKGLSSSETVDLFIVGCVRSLREGGMAAIVVPDGPLYGTNVRRRIREYVFESSARLTILRLPSQVFAPYTLIKTNVIIIEKGSGASGAWFYSLPPAEESQRYPLSPRELTAFTDWYAAPTENGHAWFEDTGTLERNELRLDRVHPEKLMARRTLDFDYSRVDSVQSDISASHNAVESWIRENLS